MAFAIILLETFAVYLMIMISIQTDILAMRLKGLGECTVEVDDDEMVKNRKDCLLLIKCFQTHSSKSR